MYNTYRVLLTHTDVEERGLDIPEDLFDLGVSGRPYELNPATETEIKKLP